MSFNVIAKKSVPGYFCTAVYINLKKYLLKYKSVNVFSIHLNLSNFRSLNAGAYRKCIHGLTRKELLYGDIAMVDTPLAWCWQLMRIPYLNVEYQWHL